MAHAPRPRLPVGLEPRRRAFSALVAVEGQGLGTQQALRDALDLPTPLEGPDRALVSELVYGVERCRRPLDRWIAAACARGLYQIDLEALTVLRLGAYQLAWLDRVPAFAAVDTATELARQQLPHGRIAFVHGVLRELGRRHAAGDRPTGDEWPAWIGQRLDLLANDLGLDPQAMRDAAGQPAPLYLHAVGGASEAAEAELQEAGVPFEALTVAAVPGVWRSAGGSLFATQAFATRRVIAQDAASAAVVEWLGAKAGDRVADVAAGRGVKSLCLAARGAKVTAIDVGADKLLDAKALCEQAGFPLEAVVVADASQPLDLPARSFDAVLIDAPCTALGTIRRRPEVRHRRRAADLLRLADLQRRILEQAAELCRPGGTLVFATCSFAPEEGPLTIAEFLRDHKEFERDTGDAPWIAPLLDRHGDLRTTPLHDMDAFFATRLKRKK